MNAENTFTSIFYSTWSKFSLLSSYNFYLSQHSVFTVITRKILFTPQFFVVWIIWVFTNDLCAGILFLQILCLIGPWVLTLERRRFLRQVWLLMPRTVWLLYSPGHHVKYPVCYSASAMRQPDCEPQNCEHKTTCSQNTPLGNRKLQHRFHFLS